MNEYSYWKHKPSQTNIFSCPEFLCNFHPSISIVFFTSARSREKTVEQRWRILSPSKEFWGWSFVFWCFITTSILKNFKVILNVFDYIYASVFWCFEWHQFFFLLLVSNLVIPGTSKRLNIVATVLILTLTGEIIWIKNTDNFKKENLGCFSLCKYSFSRYSLFQSRIKIILVVSIFLFVSSKSSHSQFVSRGILMLRVALKVDIKYHGMILIELSLSRFITIWWYK